MTFQDLETKLNHIESLLTTLVGEQAAKTGPPENKTVVYYTRKEVSELLNLSFPTLMRYSQLGIIPSHKVGNRVLYRSSDVEAALIKAPKI